MRNDDDIKIFHPKKEQGAGSDLTQLAALMDEYRLNGNMDKAAQLGRKLATMVPEKEFPNETAKLKNKELLQLRALMAFTAQIALHKYMPHTMLSSQAINAMYAALNETSPGFFSNISDGSSFTFYYLSVRKNKDVGNEIGKNYAMLCDRDGDPEFIALGSKIFAETDGYIYSLIERFEFEE